MLKGKYLYTEQSTIFGIDTGTIKQHSGKQYLLEPSRNNTAPCIAYASYKILKQNPQANIVLSPSDHLILKETEFLNKILQALDYPATNDALVSLGISPTRPDTGYINFQKKGLMVFIKWDVF